MAFLSRHLGTPADNALVLRCGALAFVNQGLVGEGRVMKWCSGSGQIELEMTLKQAQSVSHQGQCDEDVEFLATIPKIRRQLDKIPNKLMASELREYGAWDNEQLQDNDDNRLRLVWIAGCDIAEEHPRP